MAASESDRDSDSTQGTTGEAIPTSGKCDEGDRPEQKIGDAIGRLRIGPGLSAEESAAREEQLRRRAKENVRRRRESDYERLVRKRGERYRECSLASFETPDGWRHAAVVKLRAYSENLWDAIDCGEGLLFFGPPGTGKDHLLWSLVRQAVLTYGRGVEWVNGMDLFGDVRDAIGTGHAERALVSALAGPEVLAISDPLPPAGKLTEFQAAMLFRVLDARYSRCRATWVTVNVSGRTELDERMGPQLADRLVDGALCVFCNWPSYRKAK